MPLQPGTSRAVVSGNISEMMNAGHKRSQAVAASLRNARQYGKKFADGGPSWTARIGARGLAHSGMIHSPVPGRTDKLPISVKGGAYILPADHVSAMGQGNSAAGADILNRMFRIGGAGGPGVAMGGVKAIRPTVPKLTRMRAQGGTAGAPPLIPTFSPRSGEKERWHRASEDHVPIIAAGGEYAIPPDKVAEIGGGDVDRGHQILDHWVRSARKQHIKTLSGLKPPKK